MRGELEWCRASGLAPEKRQRATAIQGFLLAGTEGGGGRVRERAAREFRGVLVRGVRDFGGVGDRGYWSGSLRNGGMQPATGGMRVELGRGTCYVRGGQDHPKCLRIGSLHALLREFVA